MQLPKQTQQHTLGDIVSGVFTAGAGQTLEVVLAEKQVETWQRGGLADVTGRVVIYEEFVESRLSSQD